MFKIAALAFAIALGCVAVANAQLFGGGGTPETTGDIYPTTFINKVSDPVWVTYYTSNADSMTSGFTIQKAVCVLPNSSYSFDMAANEVKIQAQAQKGHGNLCNTGTYWDGSITKKGIKSIMSPNESATAVLTPQSSGATTLTWQ
jgi:hypothetical protein